MKTTIVILVILLLGVSAGFGYEYVTLKKQSDQQTAALTNILTQNMKLQTTATKQTATINAILGCANTTEKAYKANKTYVSVVSCIKTRLKI